MNLEDQKPHRQQPPQSRSNGPATQLVDRNWCRVSVLGVPVDPVTSDKLHEIIEQCLRDRVTLRIATVNAEYVMRARHDPGFLSILEQADVTTADGAGIVWALRRLGICLPGRVGGSDLIWSIAEICARAGARLFLLGGAPGIAQAAGRRLRGVYPELVLAGTHAGSGAVTEEARIVDVVRRSRADVLFVAFGAPGQDVWLARNLRSTGAMIGMGVGGSFDYVSGTTRRAPVWMQEHGLEWLWRLIRQPWRWRRMLVLPHFAWLVMRSR